jgi:hypothetical protein
MEPKNSRFNSDIQFGPLRFTLDDMSFDRMAECDNH